MKCIVFGPDDGKPTWAERERPKLKAQHVVVKVEAVGLNPVDAKGVIGDKLSLSSTLKSFSQSWLVHNTIIGFDFAGIVVESTDLQYAAGQKVFGTMPPLQGSLAEFICAPLHQLCTLPNHMDSIQAATVPLVGLTALQCLQGCSFSNNGNNWENRKVLVVGASGGTGHVFLQVAQNLGASTIVAMCSAPRAQFCQSCGATATVDYTDDTWPDKLAQLGPFDVIIDCVTSDDPRDVQFRYPEFLQKAPYVTSDYQYRRLGGPFKDWVRAGMERTTGISLWPNQHEKLFWIRFPHSASQLQTLAKWMVQGKLKTNVAQVYDFEPSAVQEAFDSIMSRRLVGKVAVKVQTLPNNNDTTKTVEHE